MWTQRTDWELGARRKKEEGGEEEEEERRGDVGRGRKFVDACVVVCLQVRSPFAASLAIFCLLLNCQEDEKTDMAVIRQLLMSWSLLLGLFLASLGKVWFLLFSNCMLSWRTQLGSVIWEWQTDRQKEEEKRQRQEETSRPFQYAATGNLLYCALLLLLCSLSRGQNSCRKLLEW